MNIDKDTLNIIFQILNVVGILGATGMAALNAKFGKDSIEQSKKQDDPSKVIYVRQNTANIHIIEMT